jgi:2-polyprenyl-6-methoxyphenol hydroxylase-like FAD-dependent oxidoreductase
MTRTLVVGGGISGAAAALSLATRGHEVTLVERAPELRPLGSGITLIGPAVRALYRLGLGEECLANGYGVNSFRVCDASGAELDVIPLPPAVEGAPGLLGMMRPTLHRVLFDAVRDGDVRVRAGVEPARLDQDPDGVTVKFSDGTAETFELVIGADGLRSSVRRMTLGAIEPTFRGAGCFRAVVPRHPGVDCEHMFIGCPTAKPGFTITAPEWMYVFCNVPAADSSRPPADELATRMRAALAPFGGVVAEIRETIVSDDQVNYSPFEVILVPPPWHAGRVVLLGDSAHATTPNLAAGGAMCLEDAVVLGEALSATASVPDAIVAYTARRFDRCKFVVETSVLLSDWELHPDTPGATPSETSAEAFVRLAGPY